MCMSAKRPPSQRGFTLIEVLVALVLLALLTLTSYRALNAVLEAERHARAEMSAWQSLALVFTRIEADLQDAVSPAVPASVNQPGFLAERLETGKLAFSFDRQLPADEADGLRRVQYLYLDGSLSRADWPHTQTVLPTGTELLVNLSGLELRFLDREGVWQGDWPASRQGILPRAVELQLAWPDGRAIRRVFRCS